MLFRKRLSVEEAVWLLNERNFLRLYKKTSDKIGQEKDELDVFLTACRFIALSNLKYIPELMDAYRRVLDLEYLGPYNEDTTLYFKRYFWFSFVGIEEAERLYPEPPI